jgi:hypothetical protein
MISNLKQEVIPEEVVLAKEALKKRDKQADESYSDYKMALKVIVQRAYNSYDQTEVDGKVLERFLDGLGKAGRAVRLQAPAMVEDAIAKAIAYEMETSHGENAGQVFLVDPRVAVSWGTAISVAKGATRQIDAECRNQATKQRKTTTTTICT